MDQLPFPLSELDTEMNNKGGILDLVRCKLVVRYKELYDDKLAVAVALAIHEALVKPVTSRPDGMSALQVGIMPPAKSEGKVGNVSWCQEVRV